MTFPKSITHASGRPLHIDPTRVVLAFEPAGRPKGLAKALKDAGLEPEDKPNAKKPKRVVNQCPRFFFARSVSRQAVPEGAAKILLDALGKGRGTKLAWVGPVYRFQGEESDHGLLAPVLDAVHVRLDEAPTRKTQRLLSSSLKRAALKSVAKRGQSNATEFNARVDLKKHTSIEAVGILLDAVKGLIHAYPDYVPLMSPAAAVPTDTYYAQQWNMPKIGAETAWNTSTGDATVFVCVIDNGIERGHEELNRTTSRGFDASSAIENSGVVPGVADITYPAAPAALNAGHGTAIASIAVGAWDVFGVAGLAGGASLFALAAPNWTAVEVADCITRARDITQPPVGGVAKRVVLLGGVSMAWAGTAVQTSLTSAISAGLLVVCPSGNTDALGIAYPGDGTHPGLIVCGSTDQTDGRWLASYGPTLSVSAPGKDIPVADLTGNVGYVTAAGDLDYFLGFEGSSSGAAHVAGLGALLLGAGGLDFTAFPGSTGPTATIGDKVKSVIERTAEKAGAVAYNTNINSRNDEVGFGRIRADWAINFADVMIKDDPLDTGVEPSTGVFWRDSDIVARKDAETLAVVNANFDIWQVNAAESRMIQVKADMTPSYCYVRVRNLGPAAATNVRVRLVAARCSTGFMYPTDWDGVEDADHIVMTPDPWPGDPAAVGDSYQVGTLVAGTSKIVRFQVSYTQGVKARDTWASGHACALSRVLSDNDHAFNQFAPAVPVSGEQARRNNLVQRNLHAVTATSPWFFPFIAGNLADPDDEMELVVDAKRLPTGALIRLALDDPERAFPGYMAGIAARRAELEKKLPGGLRVPCASLTLLDRARVHLQTGNADSLLTLEAGSRLDYLGAARDGRTRILGGNVVLDGGKRVAETRQKQMSLRMPKDPGQPMAVYLEIPVPAGVDPDDRFLVDVIQKNKAGEIVGGLSLYLIP